MLAPCGVLDTRCAQSECPRRAGRSPGWPVTGTAAIGSGGLGVAGIPSISRRATTHQPGGRARPRQTPVPSRAASGLVCDRAGPDRWDASRTPAYKIDSWSRRRAVERQEAVRNLEKYESLHLDQRLRILQLVQALKRGADELSYKPDPVASQSHDQLRRVLLACY